MTRNNCGPGLLLVLAVCVLAACGSGRDDDNQPGEGDMARIEGSVFYRERIMLPPGAEVEVQLQDISRPDAMASVLTSLRMTPEGGPPYNFTIEYDPAHFDERMRYALRATISVNDKLMFTTMEYIDPFQGNPVEVLVRRVPEPVQSAGAMREGQP